MRHKLLGEGCWGGAEPGHSFSGWFGENLMKSQTWYRATVIWKHSLGIAQLYLCHRSLLCLLTHSSIASHSSHLPSGMDAFRTVPFWLCLASGCLHLKTWLRKQHFMKYGSVEQDHIKHFLPFHTGFGIKFCIECLGIFSYLWPGSKTKTSQSDSFCASGPSEASSNASACETKLSYRSVPECKKHSQEIKYNTQPPVPPARCICLLKHKNTAAKQMYMKWPKQCIQHCSPSGRKRRR